jgi:uncharacterized protein YhaN
MIIKKMTASFGTLQNESLELKDGLNILRAPNESGKSTWCAFINSMLYGVDSSAREKGGNKPDKIKYAPWSGAPMSGTMDVEYEGENITLTRMGSERSPMRELSVTYTGTSQTAEGIGPVPGETMLGVPKDVFERSAFIGQGKVAVSASPELERRIAAIVQTGDENSSCTEAEEKLRAAMRKRRHNRSGRLPEIEAEIADERARLSEIDAESRRGEALMQAKARAIENRDALTEKVAKSRMDSRREALETLTNSRNRVRTLEAELADCREKTAEAERALYADFFKGRPLDECTAEVNSDTNRIRRIDDRLAMGAVTGRNKISLAVFAVLFAVFTALGVIGLDILWETAFFWVTFVGFTAGLGFALLTVLQAARIRGLKRTYGAVLLERDVLLAKYRCSTAGEVEKLLADHGENCRRRDEALYVQRETQTRLDAEKARQAKLDAAMLKDLDFTEGGEAAELTKRLKQAEDELRRIREESAAWDGRRSALGDPEDISKHVDELLEEHRRLSTEYEALSLAADTLREAGTEIQNRLTPKLSRRAAEIFERLTGGRYEAVALDRELKAKARLAGDAVDHETAFLSVGALDQLYLAVRLAICEMALPEDKPCPLILDDALVSFDDERCLMALGLLKEMSETRQIILFTCHDRELQMERTGL